MTVTGNEQSGGDLSALQPEVRERVEQTREWADGKRAAGEYAPDAIDPEPGGAYEDAIGVLLPWLTEQSANPDDPWQRADLDGWLVRQVGDWHVFEPPWYANRLFLVSERGVYSFAPSMESLEEALSKVNGTQAEPDGA